jgi:hypothetical protein
MLIVLLSGDPRFLRLSAIVPSMWGRQLSMRLSGLSQPMSVIGGKADINPRLNDLCPNLGQRRS